ncbi:MAG: rhomboid family intramembrane serine protease [Candidatus Krumholzibacteriia bacterium]
MGTRYGTGGGLLRFGPSASPTVRALLAANVTVFIIQWMLGLSRSTLGETFIDLFGLVPALAIPRLYLWQFATYMFLHGGFWHLAFNMFALWMFGSEIEALWGRRAFLTYYFVTGLGGGLTYTLTSWGSTAPLVGASGAIFGLLLAYGLLFPDREILLYFLIPIKARYFVLLFGLLELLAAWLGSGGNIGHFAHLGGMLFGYIWLKAGLQRHLGAPASWRRRQARARFRVISTDQPAPRAHGRERIDAILEKISREGLQSLTPEEQDILRGASRREH